MRNQYHTDRETKRRVDVGIDWPNIVVNHREDAHYPLKKNTKNIRAQNIKKDASNKPKNPMHNNIVTKEWLKKRN